jgi:hypothetical protein
MVVLAAPAFAASDDDLRKAIVGTWSDQADCNGAILVFNADGTFMQASADDHSKRSSGTYTIANGRLSGTADGEAMPDTPLSYDGTHLAFQNDDGSSDPMNPCPPLPPLAPDTTTPDTTAPTQTPPAQ